MAKILVIDDSPFIRNMWRRYLEAAGFEVEDFLPSSVSELMERIKQSPPDLVLSDFNMPVVNGQNIARGVRETSPKTPVIILTANQDEARDAILQSIGVSKIIYKPIQEQDLVAAVNNILALK